VGSGTTGPVMRLFRLLEQFDARLDWADEDPFAELEPATCWGQQDLAPADDGADQTAAA
jgi:hypothetical protein